MSRGAKRAVLAAAVVVVIVAGGVSIAGATGGGDDDSADRALTGVALDRAKAIALRHTGGGRVTGSEVGDEEGYYEVEVTREDGTQVDVHLSRTFEILGGQADGDGSHDTGPHDD